MEAVTDLPDEITALIEPWLKSEEEPPFSYRELITMAFALKKEPMTLEDVVQWAAFTFKYYSNIMCAYCLTDTIGTRNNGLPDGAKSFVTGLMETFDEDFELPVTKVFNKDCDDDDSKRCTLFEVSSAAVRMVLRHHIPEKIRGTFPFLQLPAELRATIYEMVFRYSQCGLMPMA